MFRQALRNGVKMRTSDEMGVVKRQMSMKPSQGGGEGGKPVLKVINQNACPKKACSGEITRQGNNNNNIIGIII